jgi:hypothetical protein
MSDELKSLIERFSDVFGKDELVKLLEAKLNIPITANVLTIICDETLHRIPSRLIHGEAFVFSTGNFDTSTGRTLATHIEARTLALCKLLNSTTWTKVRLIFSGHAILAATAKLAVYRVTHLETEDVLYFGAQGYLEMTLKFRELLGNSISAHPE